MDRLAEKTNVVNEGLNEVGNDLRFLDDDTDRNKVTKANDVTVKPLNKKDCCFGYGYWPVIFLLLIVIIIGIIIISVYNGK